MKGNLALRLAALTLLFATGCATQHQYVVERVKDVDGNDAFLRIDLTEGDECAIGHGFAVVRAKPGVPAAEGYLVPFCGDQGKK
ncbi:MAG: hypothetical protein WAN76_10060 [Candidatus Sulfotelmatobacter sp.]